MPPSLPQHLFQKMSVILLLPSASQVHLPKGHTWYICVWLGYLQTWMLTVHVITAPYTTSTEDEMSEDEWRNLKSHRDSWCLLYLLFSLWLIFSLCIYRQLTPGTPSLWRSIPSVFHGSLARLIRRSKARKTLSLWASWISLASRTFRSGFCLLQGGLVLEMSVHIGRNFGSFVSYLG